MEALNNGLVTHFLQNDSWVAAAGELDIFLILQWY